MPIETVGSLRQHLQWAIELEHATIPTYLCALYSIKDGTNQKAVDIIRSVVMEEMLHMTLACNVLNAIGGAPSIDHPRFVPTYPTFLPHSDDAFLVHLEKFSPDALETFLKIELPAKKDAPHKAEGYSTIGQFYEAIEDAFKLFCREPGGEKWLFSGDPARQIGPDTYYYGGGGKVVVVQDLDSALAAMEEIIEQGEGLEESVHDAETTLRGPHQKKEKRLKHVIQDGDEGLYGMEDELAHYFRFNEVLQGRFYCGNETPEEGPQGEYFSPAVDWSPDAVYQMRTDPKTADYKEGSPLWEKSVDFNRAYTGLLHSLHRAFNGAPDQLIQGVAMMYQLKDKAQALMKIPFGDGTTAGPSFEYWPPPPPPVISIPEKKT